MRMSGLLCVAAQAAIACGLLMLCPSCAASPPNVPAVSTRPTTIILVRHGERDSGFNPPLNEAGLARAQALLEALDESRLTAIYAPELLRTMQTAQPIAEHLGLEIQRIGLLRLAAPETLAKELLAEILERHAGGVVLYVGNDSNLEALYYHLGGTGQPPVRHQDIYTAVIGEDGEVHFIKGSYGKTK